MKLPKILFKMITDVYIYSIKGKFGEILSNWSNISSEDTASIFTRFSLKFIIK